MRKRSVLIAGHPTSISLEEPFWEALKEEATARGLSVNALVEAVDATRTTENPGMNLSSALRVHLLQSYRARALPLTPSGHGAAAEVPAPPSRG